jgi:hypothetical protein
VQIGDELQVHNELLEDTDAAMDRTADRMNRARGGLTMSLIMPSSMVSG